MNLYEILGVSSNCSPDNLRQQYHRLLLEYHPDKTNSKDSITINRFEDIQNAYRILSNVELRLKYDQEQERRHLHTLPHTNINYSDFNDDNEYTCRCGTVLQIDKETHFHIIECPNCSTRVEIENK
jgi:DnaJ-class molecular chaperone